MIQSWLGRQRSLQTGLRASARGFGLAAAAAIAVRLIDGCRGAAPDAPGGEVLLAALGLAVALTIARARPASKRTCLAQEIDQRRHLEDRLQTVAELEPVALDRPFGAALFADTRNRLAALHRPLFGRSRLCALWTLWVGLWLGLPGMPPSSMPPANDNSLPRETSPPTGSPRPQGGGGSLALQPADAMPDRPPTGVDSEPIPPDPIDLDDANRLPKFMTPLRQEGEQHEKEVAVQDREVAPRADSSQRPPGERVPEEAEHPLAESHERVRRTALPPDRRGLVRRYFERIRK